MIEDWHSVISKGRDRHKTLIQQEVFTSWDRGRTFLWVSSHTHSYCSWSWFTYTCYSSSTPQFHRLSGSLCCCFPPGQCNTATKPRIKTWISFDEQGSSLIYFFIFLYSCWYWLSTFFFFAFQPVFFFPLYCTGSFSIIWVFFSCIDNLLKIRLYRTVKVCWGD